MLNNINKEIHVDLKDLIFVLIKKIGIMLIVGLIIGGVLGVNRVLKRMKTNDVLDASARLNENESEVQYDLRVQNINKARVYVEMIDNINNQIDHQKDYIANSIYMQIDAENVYQSTAQITLTLENNDTNGIDEALFGAYGRNVSAGNYLDEYAKKIGKKPDYIKELIWFSSSVSTNTIISIDKDVDRVGSMYISVVGPSREFCDDVMNLVIGEVENSYIDLNSNIAPHKISIVGIQQIQKIDSGIRDVQISHTGSINSLQNQIASYYTALDNVAKELGLNNKEDILQYFSDHPEVVVDGVPSVTSEKNISRWSNIKPGIKFFVIGFCVGIFLVALFYFIKYLFGRKFITQSQFFGTFNQIEKIGVMKPQIKRSILGVFCDIKTEDDTNLSTDINAKLISANFINLTRNYNKVLITGTADNKLMREVVKSLDLKGDFKPNLFSDPSFLVSVPDYDAVVLLEQRNYSIYKDIDKEISYIINADAPIIGAIII